MISNSSRIGITDIVLLLITGLYFAGTMTVFAPCGPKADGSFMACHWAGQALRGMAAGMLILAVLHVFSRDRGVKTGISLALMVMAGITFALPGHLIQLCMMEDMRCHLVTKPAGTVSAVLTLAAAAADLIAGGILKKPGNR